MAKNNTTIDGKIRVCTQISLSAECPQDISEGGIGWKIKIDKDEHRLEDLKTKKILLGENIVVTGKDISFVVPKEWGQKTVTIIAYLQEDQTQLVNETYLVLDHIVAAFYRIDVDKPKTFVVEDIIPGEKTKHLASAVLKNDPFYHFQGMYKDPTTNTIYVSYSSGSSIYPYIYILDQVKGQKDRYKGRGSGPDIFEFKGDYNKYHHPGGIQSASNDNMNILAVGFEKYKPGGAGTYNVSLIGFFDINKNFDEHLHLRIIKDPNTLEDIKGKDLPQNTKPEADWASAEGIVWLKEKNFFLFVSRGSTQNLSFYKIDEYGSRINFLNRIDHVGEFQNVNLIINELEEVYIVGFESRKRALGSGEDTNFVWIYQLDITDKEIYLKPVWINEKGLIATKKHHIKGYIKETMYTKNKVYYEEGEPVDIGKNKPILFDKNSRQVTTQDGASFQWASCIHLGKPKEEDEGKLGFINNLTMYSVCSVHEKDEDTYKRYCDEYKARKTANESNTSIRGQLPCYTVKPGIITEDDYYPTRETYLSKEDFDKRMNESEIEYFVKITFNSFT